MHLRDLLGKLAIDPQTVLVLRHRPSEPELRKVLPWLAAEEPEVFNAYQQTQGRKLENAMKKLVGSGVVASFIGHEPGKALFVGFYRIGEPRPMTRGQYWRVPAHVKMKAFGMQGWTKGRDDRRKILWFDLRRMQPYLEWSGKLVIGWPPPERSWWRRAHRNEFPVLAIREESALNASMPSWDELELSWTDLQVLPQRWRTTLAEWRGIYLIFDASDRRGYVGSAYGESNILGRWLKYASRGHGGNVQLRKRDPTNFRFTILQRVSPDLDPIDVIELEASWKRRLHTRHPYGLNDN